MFRLLLYIHAFLLPIVCCFSQIVVCHECPVNTLEEALQQAENGDHILVKKGQYFVNDLLVDKSVHIDGEQGAILDGKEQGGILVITADSVHVSGLRIQNVGKSYTKDFAAIKLRKTKGFVIENNHFENVFFGIFVEKSKRGIIKNNTLHSVSESEFNSGNGIHLWHCKSIQIEGNHVSGLRDGIYLEFVDKSRIENNVCENNLRYGLHFMFSHENEYINNRFENNGAGVAVMFSKHIKMIGNTFLKNWGTASYGLLLKEINDAEISKNTFEENTIGIHAEGTNRINYFNNSFVRNGWAVRVRGACFKNIFHENNFLFNTFDISYQGNLNENEFNSNYWSSYTGYDLDKDGIGDIPYRPVKLFSYIVNRTPETIILLRSLFIDMINFSEKVSPIFTPDNLLDTNPLMKEVR